MPGSWFDDRARAAARRDDPTVGALSRRRFLQRGAVVGGAAWVAPTLLAASPAWAQTSQCTPSQVCGVECCDAATQVCDTSGAAATCRALPGEGQACIAGRCSTGLTCTSGTCARPGLPRGASCSRNSQCASGTCYSNNRDGLKDTCA